MGKDEAIRLLGGTKAKAARVMGVTRQSIGAWPDPLTPRIADRVRGVLSRLQPSKGRRKGDAEQLTRRSGDRRQADRRAGGEGA
jgi:hypothetical protein